MLVICSVVDGTNWNQVRENSMSDLKSMILEMGNRARQASRKVATMEPGHKNTALQEMADLLRTETPTIVAENAKDLAAAEENGLTSAMVDRLRLDEKRIDAMARAVEEIAALPDPVGEMENIRVRPNGLRLGHVRAPIGVIGFIYESRPNVTSDAAALCLKSGNAVILRGGKEAIHSNMAISAVLARAVEKAGVPEGAIQIVPTIDRDAVGHLLSMKEYIDLMIPRGGKSLIERITRDSQIPVIKHLDGNCTVYVDEFADLDMAVPIIVNAKVQRPGVCNAAETLLVHSKVAEKFLPAAAATLMEKGVELRGCKRTVKIVTKAKPATEEDWYTEYLDLILAVRVIDTFEEAVDFINHYGSHHTEAIITDSHTRAMAFLRAIDSSCVHINCSTRFADGGEYGMGAEIGISTDKLHARGPMGLRELTTAKWVVFGNGQVRG
ncbi:MAG: glutamate-5-semialdehyde dehydrogenase [Candidatus Sumerlaeia bacterium]|nr:glutamate-5-semialdehyde dehydrogenase [Candidatus Sumerlaeia bacterium]